MTIKKALTLARQNIPRTHKDREGLTIEQQTAWKLLFDLYNREHTIPKHMDCIPCFNHVFYLYFINS